VLRTFAEISGLNIVIDPTIQGTVDVSLRDVPWDQALDIILRANKLGYVVDGTIVAWRRSPCLPTKRRSAANSPRSRPWRASFTW
jgi:type IV pilus assembly protein PilQ